MKKILIGVAVVVVLIAGGVGVLLSGADEIVRKAVETVGSKATQTEVTLKTVNLDVTGGKAELRGLTVGNPSGFGTPNAFSLGGVAVTLDTGSLTGDTIRIPSVVIDAPKVTYEWATSGSNVDVIQKNVDAFANAMGAGGGGGQTSGDGGKKLVIDKLVIRNAGVSVSADFLGGKEMGGTLPTITLTDIGKDSGGASPAEVATKVISAITDSTTKLITDLGVGDLAKGAMDAAQGAVEGAVGAASGATDAAKGAVEGVGDAAKGVGEGLKNMFGN